MKEFKVGQTVIRNKYTHSHMQRVQLADTTPGLPYRVESVSEKYVSITDNAGCDVTMYCADFDMAFHSVPAGVDAEALHEVSMETVKLLLASIRSLETKVEALQDRANGGW